MTKLARWDFLQSLIDRYGFTRYLEIGAQKGKTFARLRCQHKVGVDVNPGAATLVMPSDDFWRGNEEQFDLIFIDGLHERPQVLRDVAGALRCLSSGGIVVLHDCNPPAERRQVVPSPGYGGWNGDVWKAFVELRTRPDLDCACGDFDQGCGVVLPRPNSDPLTLPLTPADLHWLDLVRYRGRWLRLLDVDKLVDWIGDRT